MKLPENLPTFYTPLAYKQASLSEHRAILKFVLFPMKVCYRNKNFSQRGWIIYWWGHSYSDVQTCLNSSLLILPHHYRKKYAKPSRDHKHTTLSILFPWPQMPEKHICGRLALMKESHRTNIFAVQVMSALYVTNAIPLNNYLLPFSSFRISKPTWFINCMKRLEIMIEC